MKSILTKIFVGLGVVFLILILIGVCLFVVDPYNIKPLIFGSDPVSTTPKSARVTPSSSTTTTEDASLSTPQTSGGFILSEAQKQALVSFGIDPASVPTTISSEQEVCFTGVLGGSRVAEIKTGAVPSALEFFKAKSCI